MPAFSLDPNAPGDYSQWTLVGAATRWQALADSNDGTYIENEVGSGTETCSVHMQGLPAEAATVEGSVVLHYRYAQLAGSSNNPQKGGYRQGTTNDLETITIVKDGNNHEDSRTVALAPTGAPWDVPIVNGIQSIFQFNSDGGSILIKKSWTTGTYEVESGGLAFLLVSLVGALLGANLMLSDMSGIAREAAQNPRPGEGISVVRPDEYGVALAELRAHPFRRYF